MKCDWEELANYKQSRSGKYRLAPKSDVDRAGFDSGLRMNTML